MKQETANQAARNGQLVVLATDGLRQKILERVQTLVDGVHYVPLPDLLREIGEIKKMLSRLCSRGRPYTVAVDAKTAESVVLALLLIPTRQAELGSDDEKPGRAGSKEAAQLVQAGNDARRIAEQLWGKPNAVATIEGWHRELSKLDDGGLLAAQLLMAPRTEGVRPHDGNGQPLLELPPAPRSLPSREAQHVELCVGPVDSETGVAIVRVMGAEHPDGPAIKGLLERRVPLVFDVERLPGVDKLLELAQLTDTLIQARVAVTRGLGACGNRHDELQLKEIVREVPTRKAMARRLVEMNTVTGDLFQA